MDIKERSALCTFANQDEMVADLFVAIETLCENKTAVVTLCNEMLNVANRRAETFFTKLMPLGYKNFEDAINAYCADYEKRNNKED